MNKKSLALFSTVALLAIVFGVLSMQPAAIAAEESMDRLVTVNGQGTMKVAPDMAIATVAVQVTKDTAAEAAQENANIMEEVIEALEKAGITEEDIITSGYNLYASYDWVDGERILKGYQATNTIEFKTKELDDVGKYLDIAIKAGANSVNNIRFTVEDQEALKLELLELAVKNAITKADVLTRAANASRGKVVTITENSISGAFYRTADYNKVMEEVAMDGATTPIRADDIELSAYVTVAFAIQ